MTTQTEALKLARQLLWRYRHETPIGNQPHMICQEVDEAFERIDEALAQPEQEPIGEVVTAGVIRWKDKYPSLGTKLYTTPPQRKPLMEWVSVDERLPESGGYYLVTVATDDGPHVDVLMFDEKKKHWEHEGEPTFCHSYYFEPTHWAHRPEAAHGIKE